MPNLQRSRFNEFAGAIHRAALHAWLLGHQSTLLGMDFYLQDNDVCSALDTA